MSVTQDATSGKYTPSDASEWTEMLAGTGLANPANLYLMQEASGDAADSIGALDLTPTPGSTLTYQDPVAGWSRKGIRTTTDVEGYFRNSTFADVSANSYTVLLIAKVASAPAGDPASLMRIGGAFNDDACLEISTTPRLSVGEGDGTRSAGSTDPTGAVHYYWLRVDDTANTVDGFLDGTKVVGGTQACNGTELGFGGDFNETWNPPTCDYMYAAVWDSALSDADIASVNDLIDNGPAAVPAPTLASGTTLAAMQAGSFVMKYTVAIEGYPYLFTDATTQQAIDAWSGDTDSHHYTQALGGLFVAFDNSQQLDWRNPFPRGGNCTLHIVPDSSDDTFGIDYGKRNAGARTELTGTVLRDDTTLNVKSTTGFDSSGEIWIGTECIGYTGVTATSFTGCTRGKYAPLGRSDGVGDFNSGFSQTHRVGTGALEILLNPEVTEFPRRWPNKWVSVYLHKYDASIPALNSREDALPVFVGKIVSVTDDPNTGAMVIELKHVLDVIAEATIGGRNQWSGRIRNVVFLQYGMTFTMKDSTFANVTNTTTNKSADDLVVVISGAATDYEINQGYYTTTELHEKLNAWLTAAKGGNDLIGTYAIAYNLPTDGSVQTRVDYQFADAGANDHSSFQLGMPRQIAAWLGWINVPSIGHSGTFGQFFAMVGIEASNIYGSAWKVKIGDSPVLRAVSNYNGAQTASALIDNEQGTFTDQYDFLPASSKPPASIDDGFGVFLVDNHFLVLGAYKKNAGTLVDPDVISNMFILADQMGLPGGGSLFGVPWRQGEPEYTDIRQIFVLEMGLADALIRILASTGTLDYNLPDYDTLSYGVGISIPSEILESVIADAAALPHSDQTIVLAFDKAVSLSKLLAGEMILRRAFFCWRAGRLRIGTWRSATDSNSEATLVEANKAEPADSVANHRSVTTEDGQWAVPIVNIRYNRQLTSSPNGSENYSNTLTIADKAALDDLGGDGPSINIDCRGTFGDFMQTGTNADSLAAGFMATMPYFSRPSNKSSRSIDQRFFEVLTIGSVVTVTDAYARDPDTGRRGVATRHGIVTRIRYSLGGKLPGSDEAQPQGGEVDLFFLDVNRVAAYVPCAQVDDTATNGGYDDGAQTLTVYAHKYSESTEAVDASHFAEEDIYIDIIEIDPADPASPQIFQNRLLNSVSGNVLDLEDVLGVDDVNGDAWDSAKKYRVVFSSYATATAGEQIKTYQADTNDWLIADARGPFEYGTGTSSGLFTRWAVSDPVELPPDASFGDGVGRDVGHEVALARLLNNLVNHKTAVSSPCLSDSVLQFGASPGSVTWKLKQCRPVHLSDDILLADCYRKVAVAPHYRSADGSSVSLRVTLAHTPPTGTSLFDVDRGTIISSTTFTTSSTTFSTPTAVELNAGVKDSGGTLWVLVEITEQCETWGLAHFQETGVRILHTIQGL